MGGDGGRDAVAFQYLLFQVGDFGDERAGVVGFDVPQTDAECHLEFVYVEQMGLSIFIVCFIVDSGFTNEKQKLKILKMSISDGELFTQILHKYVKNEDLLTPVYMVEAPISDGSDKVSDEDTIKVGTKHV